MVNKSWLNVGFKNNKYRNFVCSLPVYACYIKVMHKVSDNVDLTLTEIYNNWKHQIYHGILACVIVILKNKMIFMLIKNLHEKNDP